MQLEKLRRLFGHGQRLAVFNLFVIINCPPARLPAPPLLFSYFLVRSFFLHLHFINTKKIQREGEEKRKRKMESNNKQENNSSVGSDSVNIPEECVAMMVSLTSPRDACRLSAVSSTFRSAAESDIVWSRFLPSDYLSLLSRAVHPVTYASKRELFFLLSGRHILIDRGKMVCHVLVLIYLPLLIICKIETNS